MVRLVGSIELQSPYTLRPCKGFTGGLNIKGLWITPNSMRFYIVKLMTY